MTIERASVVQQLQNSLAHRRPAQPWRRSQVLHELIETVATPVPRGCRRYPARADHGGGHHGSIARAAADDQADDDHSRPIAPARRTGAKPAARIMMIRSCASTDEALAQASAPMKVAGRLRKRRRAENVGTA
jgi:hypothetical protein